MIFFRADSNDIIASGHIMRCISLASYFKEMKFDVLFLIADNNAVPLLQEADMPFCILNSKWDNLLSELDIVIPILQNEVSPILIIDSYSVNKEYIEKVSLYAKVCYLGSKKEYLGDLDCLINYSTDIDELFYRVNYPRTKLLLGPSYAPLRKEFQNVEEHYNKTDIRILLTTGYSDPLNCTPKILQKLEEYKINEKCYIDVVIGQMFKNVDVMVSRFNNSKNINFYRGTKLSLLMHNSSLAISANGTTVYELASSHVPIISFSIVPEQVKSAETLSKLGVLKYAGQMYSNIEGCLTSIVTHILEFISKPSELEILGKNAHRVIGGNGCEKIFNVISTL